MKTNNQCWLCTHFMSLIVPVGSKNKCCNFTGIEILFDYFLTISADFISLNIFDISLNMDIKYQSNSWTNLFTQNIVWMKKVSKGYQQCQVQAFILMPKSNFCYCWLMLFQLLTSPNRLKNSQKVLNITIGNPL